MSYIKNILIWGDQGINTFAGGNPDCTISACAHVNGFSSGYWRAIEVVVNATFEPIDGPEHCYQSFEADKAESYTNGGLFRKVFIGVAVIAFCAAAYVPFQVVGMVNGSTSR